MREFQTKTRQCAKMICATLSQAVICYPKDFKFTGWHPLCRCHVVTVLKTDEEMAEDTRRLLNGEQPKKGSVNTVRDVPLLFNKWIEDNRERAKGWSNMPYFVRDNVRYVDNFQVDTYSPAERKFTRAHRTKPAMKEMLNSWLHGKYPDIPTTEMAAIYHYTRGDISDYRQLNKQLRNNALTEFNLAFSELLSSALEKLPNYEGISYRTLRLKRTNISEWIRKAVNKETITFEGFTSSSESLEIINEKIKRFERTLKSNEEDIILVINSRNGKKIKDFSQFDGLHPPLPNQKEILFDKEGKFQFESFEISQDGRLIFHIREL